MIETSTYAEIKEIIISRHIYPVIVEYENYVVIIASDGVVDARYNILKKSAEFADLIADNWKTVRRSVLSSGNRVITNITRDTREPVCGLSAQPHLDKTITNVTFDSIEFTTSPLVNESLTAAVAENTFSIPVGSSVNFTVGMRVVVEEAGKQLSIGIVESIPDGTTVNIVPGTKDAYTTSALLRQCVKGRQVYVNYGNSLSKFRVTVCTPTSITVDNRGIDLTSVTQTGNTIRFNEEELKLGSITMGGFNDASYVLDVVSQEFYGDLNRYIIFENWGKSLPQVHGEASVIGANYGYFLGSAYDFKQKVPEISMSLLGEIWS